MIAGVLLAQAAEGVSPPLMMVTRSEYPLSFTMRVAWSAIAERSIPYTCFAPACRRVHTIVREAID